MNGKILRAFQAAAVLLVLLALCSCQLFNTLNAYSLYSQAFKKLEEAGGYEAECIQTVNLNIMGQSLPTTTEMVYRKNGDDIQSVMKILGAEITSTRIGDIIYIDNGTTGVKYSISEQTESGKPVKAFGSAEIPELAKDVFDNIDVVKNNDGTKTVTVAIDGDTAKKYFEEVFSGEDSVSLGNIVFDMIFDKKNDLKGMKISCSFEIGAMGATMSGDVTADYTFVNFGKAPEIKLNLEESKYTEDEVIE